MNVAFTICSNNYLAHARVLLESWQEFNPETPFFIFLVDEFDPDIDYSQFKPAKIILFREVVGELVVSLAKRFDITALNTALKPDAFIHLFKQHKWQKVIYLDPDILVKGGLTLAFQALGNCTAILTPHINSPVDDEYGPNDVHLLPTGIYNLGFLGLSYTKETERLLSWWRERTMKYGYLDESRGLFYDQVWMNYAPIFFDRVAVLKDPGYNMANWNLHERQLSQNDSGKYMVNNSFPLCFFHFSGFKYQDFPNKISSYHSRYSLHTRPDIKALFTEYYQRLISAGIEGFMPSYCFKLFLPALPSVRRRFPALFPALPVVVEPG